MGHFVLGILIALPCDDPYDYVGRVMEQQKHGHYTIDGWEILELEWSKRADATPYAYISPEGSWHERTESPYSEEEARSQQIHTIMMEHIAHFLAVSITATDLMEVY